MDSQADYEISEDKNPRTRYPFKTMKIGQKCVFRDGINVKYAQSAASYVGRINGWRFVSRVIDGKLTVWRTK